MSYRLAPGIHWGYLFMGTKKRWIYAEKGVPFIASGMGILLLGDRAHEKKANVRAILMEAGV
jgi:hypothetical protein